jgi:hypothetical protein
MLPGSILRCFAMSIALAFAAVNCAAAQPAEVNPSQKMAMQALSDICAKDMPDVAKIQAFASSRWHEPQRLKGLDYWSIGVPGKAAFFLGVGNQDNGQTCTVSFAGKAADAVPAIETRFKVSKSQVVQGKRIWLFTLNGKEGMVFVEDHPQSRFNINVGIYLE